MSILDAFEIDAEPIITPGHFYQKEEPITDTAVVCFSYKALDFVLAHYEHEIYVTMPATCNGKIDIYFLPQFQVLFFMSPIGASIAGGLLQEMAYLASISKFVYFGSCGVLDPALRGRFITPTACYREEGFSYHFAPPADYIDMKNSAYVSSFMEKRGIPFATGKGWTTDAIFNETKKKWAARKKEGVICVDMEASGLQAIADHIGVKLYIFFFGGDILGENWECGDLGGENERRRQCSAVEVALQIGSSLSGKTR